MCERAGVGGVLQGERKAGHEPGNLYVCVCVKIEYNVRL